MLIVDKHMTERNIFKKTLDFGNEIITRIKITEEKSKQEYFQRVFCTPPEIGKPNTRRRGEIMGNGVMFYNEQWSSENNCWIETDRNYYSSRVR